MTFRHSMTALATGLALSIASPVFAQTAAPADAATQASKPAGSYNFDPKHSQIIFSYEHMGFSTSYGMVNGVTGTVTLDDKAPENSTVEASFPLSSLLTIDKELDQHLMGEDFFKGVAPDTAITFKSTKVEPKDDSHATITGDLTLNGVTKPITLNATLNKAGENPMTKQPSVGFTAEGSLKRSDFNLGAFVPAVSDEIKLIMGIEAMR